MDRQGIITAAPAVERERFGQTTRLGLNWTIDNLMLRYFSLYWDHITLVSATPFGQSLSGDSELLAKAGVLSKSIGENPSATPLRVSKEDDELALLFDQQIPTGHYINAVSKEINRIFTEDKTCDWTIHNRFKGIPIASQYVTNLITAKIELNGCLPVPIENIHIEDVLNFKHKRNDELIALRGVLDELYLEISKSSDINFAKKYEIERLKKSIIELNKVSRESFGLCNLIDRQVSIDLNLGSATSAVITGSTIGSYTHPVFGLGATLVAGLLSSIKFTANVSTEFSGAIGSQKLSYISALHGKGWL